MSTHTLVTFITASADAEARWIFRWAAAAERLAREDHR